jgi:hypothetical protein
MKTGDAITIIADDSVYKGCHGTIKQEQHGAYLVAFKKAAERYEKTPEYEMLFLPHEIQLKERAQHESR